LAGVGVLDAAFCMRDAGCQCACAVRWLAAALAASQMRQILPPEGEGLPPTTSWPASAFCMRHFACVMPDGVLHA
jgi:hypothetical protein